MTLKVMHPLHCLLSRVSNTALANQQTALAERQLLTAILLVPAYGRAILDLTGDPRPVMETNEKVYDTARSRNEARQLYTRGIDITDAVLVDSRLPAALGLGDPRRQRGRRLDTHGALNRQWLSFAPGQCPTERRQSVTGLANWLRWRVVTAFVRRCGRCL
jgi:hypothetical protein